MAILIRTNGKEKYRRPYDKHIKAMEKAGLFTDFNYKHSYIEGDYDKTSFEFNGRKYKIEYFSGCFYPFLLELLS